MFGVITNGSHKLDVSILTDEPNVVEKLERGSKLEITGDLQESGAYTIFNITNNLF